jgi:integrase
LVGFFIDPDYVTSRFNRFLKEKKLPHIRFHDLRHSSASLLINKGFTLKEVQEWLGHADIASTDIYSHLLYKSKENMASKVNEALSF